MLFDVPAISVLVSVPDSCHGIVVCAGSEFQATSAVRSAAVSNTCARLPGSGHALHPAARPGWARCRASRARWTG